MEGNRHPGNEDLAGEPVLHNPSLRISPCSCRSLVYPLTRLWPLIPRCCGDMVMDAAGSWGTGALPLWWVFCLLIRPEHPRTTVLFIFSMQFVWLLRFFVLLFTLEVSQLFSLYVTESKWHGPPSKVLSSYKERALQKDGSCKDSPSKLSHVSPPSSSTSPPF